MKNKWKWMLVLGAVLCFLTACGEKEKTVGGVMTIDDVFTLTGKGTVVTGTVESGKICVGDEAVLQKADGTETDTSITGLEEFRNMLEEAVEGQSVGVYVETLEKEDVEAGDRLIVYTD